MPVKVALQDTLTGLVFMNEKKCKVCKKPFNQFNSLQVVCDPKCALKHARTKEKERVNKLKAKQKDDVKSLLTRKNYMDKAQSAFNGYIRTRDLVEPCISCRTYSQDVQYHAGHFRTTKSQSGLRFHPMNCWKQCASCNNHLSGNILKYRVNLLKKLGQKWMDFLEKDYSPCHLNIEQLERLAIIYRKKKRLYERRFR